MLFIWLSGVGELVDGEDILVRERVEGAELLRVAGSGEVGEAVELAVVELRLQELWQAHGQAEALEVGDHLLDAEAGALIFRAAVCIYAEDALGELREAGGVILIDVLGPGAPERRQRGAVRRVEAGAELVAELVDGEVLAAAELCEVGVGDAAAPHDLAHGIVILVVLDGTSRSIHDSLDEVLGHAVGEDIGFFDFCEVALERVHDDVGDATDELLLGDGEGQLRIHEGEDWTVERRVEADLAHRVLVRQHGGVARLAACGSERQHGTDGHGLREFGAATPEIPDVRAGVGHAVGDGLCRVDDAAAADGEDEVGFEGECLADALAHERNARIRLDAAEHLEGEARGCQLALDAREQTAPDDAAAAVDDVDAARAIRAQLLGHAVLGMAAEDDLRRHLELKTLHKKTS